MGAVQCSGNDITVPTDRAISRAFIEFSALEQVVAIHSGMASEWVGPVSSHAKPVEGHRSLVVKVMDLWLSCNEVEPNVQGVEGTAAR
ncbi:hypothetical protein TNCV_454201 [Trichonephila clavipes]|nr:hypothetical protein TNCV_454201 [Trichonephila clavipes]